ncbi:type IV pilus secretin PilQ [Acinetobacter sp. ACNIH3]|uniref:type IV pilus secretin PilQ family protein n=1 Tax=unclassified Acinetobacter TaxID=196816 RepID=UPI000CDDB0F4|nr:MULTISPECIES: type IV pilus secretin PilQ family protein [unclassified Acinetobacter]POU27408.1 type IV pilus secretin PilQ [Acinetobacter sp. ACNIH3]POV77899.1 type IV pilus secretin PilQ [Acinetobacter sp. ACNIH4]
MNKSFKEFIFGDANTMNHVFRQFSMGAVAIAVMQAASAQVSMTNVVPMQIPGQGTEIRVMFNGLPPQPQAYQLESPSRLILDFDKAQQNLKQSNIVVATKEASSVDVTSDAQRARLTVNLADAGAFTTRVEGNTFILKINSTNPVIPVQPVVQQNTQGITNIGFQRGAKGEGQVVIDLASGNTPVDVQQQGTKVIVRALGSKIPTHLTRRLNVNDFATPVSTVDAVNQNGSGVITIQTSDSYEYMAYQTDNKLTISLKRPEEKNPLRPKAAQHYTGKKISLDFQDIEVRRVLQLLADFTDINMVAADSVQGNITLRLKEVPWDQALDIVLKTKNLDKRRNGNVIWIAPVSELIKAEEEEAKALAQSVKLAPIQTEYMQLSYAKAADIEKLITQNKGASSAGSNTGSTSGDDKESLLSSRGSISIDARTNTLIVNDTQPFIDKIRNMVDLLDVQVKQVMVEARIVRASTEFTKEIGVKWGILSQGITNNNNLLVGGSDTTLWDLRDPQESDLGGYTYDIQRPDNLNVDLGVANPAGRIAFGLISLSDFMLDLELSALQADGYGEVISTPKVLTADKQAAKVSSGTQIPYQSSEGGGANAVSTTEFIDATLSLDVTPSITPDGKVQMLLNITSDTPGNPTPTGQLTINKNQISTNVLVDNGETVVLGGIFEQETRNGQTKVPFLGDIPYLGHLFRRDLKSDNKRELLIFITPRIVNDSVSRNH